MQPTEDQWQFCDRFLELRSNWMTLLGEHLQDHQGQQIEYWRIERADSAIVLPLQGQHILLLPPAYRPGISQATCDFPGGRVPEGRTPAEAAPLILQRELGLNPEARIQISPINATGWFINSSFSNQKLYGFVADLGPEVVVQRDRIGSTTPATPEGVQALLSTLTCLQCRTLLLEWWLPRQPTK